MRSITFYTLILLGVGSTVANAQPVPPGGGVRRPTFSPYLGLIAGGGSPGLNYMGVVRPQQQMQQQYNQLNQSLQQYNQNVEGLANSLVYGVDTERALTGHAATFLNTGHYFNSNPASRSGGGGGFGGGRGASTFGSFASGGRGAGASGLPTAPGGGGGSRSSSRTMRPSAPGLR